MNKGLTVKQLADICKKQINKGNGNKHILISRDDEGNDFHTLFYGITDSVDDIETYLDLGMIQDDNDIHEIVLLG